jgi:hypothetical protein
VRSEDNDAARHVGRFTHELPTAQGQEPPRAAPSNPIESLLAVTLGHASSLPRWDARSPGAGNLQWSAVTSRHVAHPLGARSGRHVTCIDQRVSLLANGFVTRLREHSIVKLSGSGRSATSSGRMADIVLTRSTAVLSA